MTEKNGSSNRSKGSIGEKIAVSHLLRNDYEILCTNYYTKRGEIDIIASKDKVIIFIEVKYRKNNDKGVPSESVNYRKQNKIKNTAIIYAMENRIVNTDFRFDIIEVLGTHNCSVNHIENAFW